MELAILAIRKDDLIVLVMQDQFRLAACVMGHREGESDQLTTGSVDTWSWVHHGFGELPPWQFDDGELPVQVEGNYVGSLPSFDLA